MDISRSGRVRKKSTKLADFESLSEADLIPTPPTNVKRKSKDSPQPHTVMSTSQSMKNSGVMVDELPPDQLLADDQNLDSGDNGFFDVDSQNDQLNDEDFDIDVDIKEEDFENIPFVEGDDDDDLLEDDLTEDGDDVGNSDESDEGNLMIDDARGTQRGHASKSKSSRPISSSLYFSEKSGIAARRGVGGNNFGRNRVIRSDKGSRRITAFMLWAKHMKQDVMDANPRMDFSGLSKKLGEVWATVSTSEKYVWKRRAKRLSAKEATTKSQQSNSTPPQRPTSGVTLRTSGSSPQRRFQQVYQQPNVQTRTSGTDQMTNSGLYKVVGTQPLDAAAHLKLLGESLSVIGERLTEHEGQIAVSGSLSVLLDSLLCALGPLICLTQNVPELNVIPQETLSRTLDNIAYIMPGL